LILILRTEILIDMLEIVVGQESQILPAFIMTFDVEVSKREFVSWERDVPTLMDEAAKRM
jgi:hypothetical protein